MNLEKLSILSWINKNFTQEQLDALSWANNTIGKNNRGKNEIKNLNILVNIIVQLTGMIEEMEEDI